MWLDPLFLLCGVLALCSAFILSLRALLSRRISSSIAVLLWICLGAGMILQAYAPHLDIENNKFVVPEKDPEGRTITDPIGVVGRERQINILSALLTSAAVIGLSIIYRDGIAQLRPGGSVKSQSERRVA